jgi:hypothetical protein
MGLGPRFNVNAHGGYLWLGPAAILFVDKETGGAAFGAKVGYVKTDVFSMLTTLAFRSGGPIIYATIGIDLTTAEFNRRMAPRY